MEPQNQERDPSYPRPEELSQPGSLGEEIKAHWREFHPQMYQDLSHRGLLNQTAIQEELRALEQLVRLERQGLAPDQAWEVVKADVFQPAAPPAPAPTPSDPAPGPGFDPSAFVTLLQTLKTLPDPATLVAEIPQMFAPRIELYLPAALAWLSTFTAAWKSHTLTQAWPEEEHDAE